MQIKLRHVLIIVIFVLINIFILIPLIFNNSKKDENKFKKDFSSISYIEGKKIENLKESFFITGYGNISSNNVIEISSEVQGKMQKGDVELKPGVKFKKGQLLFSVNNTDMAFNLRSRKSNYITLLANILPDIKVDYTSEYEKWKNFLDEIKINQPLPQIPGWANEKEKIFLSSKNVYSEYFSVKSQEEQLKKYHVYAPFSGMIQEVFLREFSTVNPGSRALKIMQTDDFEVAVSIPISQIENIKKGTIVKIYTTEGVEKGTGKVVRMMEVINQSTQSTTIYIQPKPNQDQKFYEGEYVKVKVEVLNEYSGCRIPKSAVFDYNKLFVYSSSDSTITEKEINFVDENEYGLFVTSLKNDEIIITQEVLNYKPTNKYSVIIK